MNIQSVKSAGRSIGQRSTGPRPHVGGSVGFKINFRGEPVIVKGFCADPLDEGAEVIIEAVEGPRKVTDKRFGPQLVWDRESQTKIRLVPGEARDIIASCLTARKMSSATAKKVSAKVSELTTSADTAIDRFMAYASDAAGMRRDLPNLRAPAYAKIKEAAGALAGNKLYRILKTAGFNEPDAKLISRLGYRPAPSAKLSAGLPVEASNDAFYA